MKRFARSAWSPFSLAIALSAVTAACFPPALERDVARTASQDGVEILEPDGDAPVAPPARQIVFASRLDHSALDILFVVDNSFSMRDEQEALSTALMPFFEHLGAHALPSLHIGVISPNLGGFEDDIPGCSGIGDDGELQGEPRVDGCTGPTPEPWVKDEVFGDVRVGNYGGSLSEAVSCIARLTNGCGFEQHLAAIGRALEPGHIANAGFLRENAKLAIIIIADEDDCSVRDRALFASEGPEELGPVSSFRCSEFGLVCDGQRLERRSGAYDECVVRTDSPYLEHPRTYAGAVRQRKGGGDIYVGAIVAPGRGIEVQPDPRTQDGAGFRVVDVCGAADSEAVPGIRFQAFLDEFPGRARRYSICGADFREPMSAMAQELAGLTGGPKCLGGLERDLQGCKVYDVTDFEQTSERRTEIPPCDGSNTPCFDITPNPTTCPATDHHLLLRVDRPRTPPPGTVLLVECEPG